MSGEEPDLTFFPTVGRDLLRELDFQLGRKETKEEAALVEHGEDRPLVESLVEIVETAGRLAEQSAARIQELEAKKVELEDVLDDVRAQLDALLQRVETAEANVKQTADHAAQMQSFASYHVARADALEQELEDAKTNLAKVSDAITRVFSRADLEAPRLPGPPEA